MNKPAIVVRFGQLNFPHHFRVMATHDGPVMGIDLADGVPRLSVIQEQLSIGTD